MKKSVKTILTIVAVIALIATLGVCFAACNKPGTKSEPLPAAGSVITIGYTESEPMNYTDPVTKKLLGFDTEVAELVFTNLGYKPVFKEIEWNNKYTDLATKNIDCVWNGFTANCADSDGVQRSEKVAFSDYYMTNKQAIVVRKDNALATANDFTNDFKNKPGQFEKGSAAEGMMTQFNGAITTGAVKQLDTLFAVEGRQADFAVVDYILARTNCGNGDYKDLMILEDLSNKLDAEKYAVGFRLNAELKDAVNKELAKLSKDGTLEQIATKYGIADKLIKNIGA